MTAIRSQHTRMFAEAIAARRQTVLEAMGIGVETNMYWCLVGQLQGLGDALKISDEADFKISGDEPDGSA